MMGTDNTQPPITPAPDHGSNDHVDPTTIALLADISLTVDAGGALADTSLNDVRRFASDLLEDDPDLEDHWRAPALVDAARHIVHCATCSEAHGAVVLHSSAALAAVGSESVVVDPARMEQAIAAALGAFDAQTPVSHARTLPVAGEASAADPRAVKAPRSAWWRTLVGSRPSPSVGGGTGGTGGTLAFLRQRGVVVAGIGVLVIASAIAFRSGRVEQVSTVAIPATTTPKASDRAAKAADTSERVELATESAASDTTVPAGFAAAASDETVAAAVAEAAPLEATAAADAPATTGPGSSSDASASVAGGAAAASELDPSPATAAPTADLTPSNQATSNQAVNSTAPVQSPRTKAAKKTAPTVAPVAPAPDQSPAPPPAAPATTASPSASVSASAAGAAAPAITAAPSSSSGATRAADTPPFDVPPTGDAASPEELLKRFSDAVARDASLSAQISARLSAPTAGATAVSTTASVPAPAIAVAAPSPSTVGRASSAATSPVVCGPADTEQIVAIGSGSIAGRAVLIRIVRNTPATASTGGATTASSFIELVDPATCAVTVRQSTP